jgi:predicted ArsR family transcriptional regulator
MVSGEYIRTNADDIIEIVKERGKTSVEEIAKILKVPMQTVQSLIDFLVEEKILGVEYKFTTPYVYISKTEDQKPTFFRSKELSTNDTKRMFYEKAKKRNLSETQIDKLWEKYLREHIQSIKDEFYRKARNRKVPLERINELWANYYNLTYRNIR